MFPPPTQPFSPFSLKSPALYLVGKSLDLQRFALGSSSPLSRSTKYLESKDIENSRAKLHLPRFSVLPGYQVRHESQGPRPPGTPRQSHPASRAAQRNGPRGHGPWMARIDPFGGLIGSFGLRFHEEKHCGGKHAAMCQQ